MPQSRPATRQGDFEAAQEFLTGGIESARQIGDHLPHIDALVLLGFVHLARAELDDAHAALTDGVARAHRLGLRKVVSEALDGCAALAAAVHQPMRALHLLGAADAINASLEAPLTVLQRQARQQWVMPLVQSVGAATAKTAFAHGRSGTTTDAIAEALQVGGPARDGDRKEGGSVLSVREREVVALIATGSSNREIAERLVIAESTAARHVANILRKLDLHKRGQVAAWAVRTAAGTTQR